MLKSFFPNPLLDNSSYTYIDAVPNFVVVFDAYAASMAKRTSFNIKSVPKPFSQFLDAGDVSKYPGTGLYVSTEKHLADETLNIFDTYEGSIPNFCAIANDSDIPIM